MKEPLPVPSPAPQTSSDAMRVFAKDQVEAARIARAELESGDHRVRLDACYLALQFLDEHGNGCGRSVESVIATARRFESFLREP